MPATWATAARDRVVAMGVVAAFEQVIDQTSEHADHLGGLVDRCRSEVDALVVEGAERSQGLGWRRGHGHPPAGQGAFDHALDEGRDLLAAPGSAAGSHRIGEVVGGHHPGRHGIFEVVAHVGDAIGPGHHLALGRGRGRAGPGVVADAVEGLHTQVEGGQHHIGTPHGVVVATDVGRERLLAGMTARPVPTVVAQGDGLGQGQVESKGAGDGHGHLGHLERVGEAGALVVGGEHEHLGLAGQPAEGGGVQDAVAIALEAGADRIGGLGSGPLSGAAGQGGAGREAGRLDSFTLGPIHRTDIDRGGRAGVGQGEPKGTRRGPHGGGPARLGRRTHGMGRRGRRSHIRQARAGV